MAAWLNLSQTLVQLDPEIRSVEQTTRCKALEKLKSMLDSRPDELEQLLQGRIYQAEVRWTDLVDSAHEGCIQQSTRLEEMQQQKRLGTVEQKNQLHWNVLQKLIALANRNCLNVPYGNILSKAFHCFGNRWMVQYFGMCYLQIVHRHVLTSKEDLQEVKISEWSRLLSYCFQLYENKSMQNLTILQCFSPIIDFGCKYTFLSTDLVQYLPKLEEIVASNLEFNALTELIKTINVFCTNLALDYRLTLCQFLEKSLGTIIKAYNSRLNDDSKVIFYKLLNLSIVVHDPDATCSAADTSYAVDQAIWHKHLRNMFHLVQTVIKQFNNQPTRLQNNPTICANFVEMAAKLCSVIFWNPLVWNDQECHAEPSQKKRRRPEKLEGIMELVEFQKGKFCWRWMTIFAQLLENHPLCVQTGDVQPILQMLHDFQLTIQYPVQVIVLHRIVRVLLAGQIHMESHLINSDFATDIWLKIAQTSFRTSSLNLLGENLRLLRQILSINNTMPNSFLESIVKTLLSNSIRKSNDGVQLLIEIFKHHNVDAFDSDYRVQTMKWLFKTDQILLNVESIRVEHVAELAVLCLFSKIDPSVVKLATNVEKMQGGDFAKFESGLRQQLTFKSLTQLIVCQREKTPHIHSPELPRANAIKSVVDEHHFQQLFEILNPDKELEETANSLDAFNRVTTTLVLYLQLLNTLIAYESMDKDCLTKTFLCKKAHFKVEQLDMCVGKFASFSDFTDKDAVDVMEALSGVFRRDLHPAVADVVMSHHMPETIRWLRTRVEESEPAKDSKAIAHRAVDELNCSNRMRYEAFSMLTFFALGLNDVETFDIINEYAFNLNSSTDLLIVQTLIKIIVKQTSSVRKAEWCFNNIKSMCQLYHRNQQICQLVVDLIPDLAYFVSGFADMTNDMILLIASFLAQTKKKKYGPHLTQSLILAMRHVAVAYADHLDSDSFRELLFVLGRFLMPHGLSIQYATVETLSTVLDTEQMRKQLLVNIDLADFHRCMFTHLQLAKLTQPTSAAAPDDLVADVDSFSRCMSVVVQLLATVICKSHILRRDAIFMLAEFIFKNELNKDYVSRVILMICSQLKVNQTTFINENIDYLLSMWLIKNYQLAKFPWFIAASASLNDFFNDHIETLTISILRHKSEILKDFVLVIAGDSMATIIEPVLAYCLAYLTPQFAKCPNMPHNYHSNCRGMFKLLKENVADLKRKEKRHLDEILQHLLQQHWDSVQFKKYFHLTIDHQADEHSIDSAQLKICLEYMKTHLETASSCEPFVVDLCNVKPKIVSKIVQTLKLRIHQSRFADQKLVTLYQYCTFLDHISDFLVRDTFGPKTKKETSYNVKSFLLRDTTHFLCNLLLSTSSDHCAADCKFKCATLKYMVAFFQRTLPKCADNMRASFNFAVSTLVALIVRSKTSDMQDSIDTAMKCLHFLVVDLSVEFTKEISLLDAFPTNGIFAELHDLHRRIKYKSHSFQLAEELDCFLQVETRKADGLAALRDQLSRKKDELAVLFRDHHSLVRQSGGNYENSCLHRLVLSLLESVQGSDEQASLEAAKCLGELGPSDLATIVLRPDSKLHTYKHFSTFERASSHMCQVALKSLNDLLTHSNPAVVKVVCNALKALLKFEEVQLIADDYPYLRIFWSSSPSTSHVYAKPSAKTVNLKQIFIEHEQSTHETWLKAFVNELFRFFDDNQLSLVADEHLVFAECMLPLLTQMLLTCDHLDGLVSVLVDSVSLFFENHLACSKTNNDSAAQTQTTSIYLNQASIKAMLNVTECIRMFNLFNINIQLKLNYLYVAKAAEYCYAHFTAILYADLWVTCQETVDKAKSDPMMLSIMKEAYTSIGEEAAVISFLDPIENRSMYLQFNKSWNHVFLEHDAQNYADRSVLMMAKSHLSSSGLFGLANVLSPQLTAKQYECAWRLSDWSLVETADECNAFDRSHYTALRCLQSKDEMGVNVAIAQARQHIIADLRSASLECTNNLYTHLQRLSLVQQIDDFMLVQFQGAAEHAIDHNVIDKWRLQDQIGCSDFKYKEPILAQRITIYKTAGLRATRKLQNKFNVRPDILQSMLLHVATESRLEGDTNLAIRYLAVLNTMNTSNEIRSKLWLEDAQLNWQLNDNVLAKKLINLCLCNTEVVSSLSRATALRIYGEFLADSCAGNVIYLIDKYFQNSLKFLDNIEKSHTAIAERMKIEPDTINDFIMTNRIRAYESIAKYSDREYNRVKTYMRSGLFEEKKQSVANSLRTVSAMGVSSNQTKEMKCARVVLNKNSEIDRCEIEATKAEHDQFLELAVVNYLKASCLDASPNHSVMFRIISLWFSNKDNQKIGQHLQTQLRQIPSYNFMAVLSQIAVRLTNSESDFGKMVSAIIERCAIDHPQQSLYQIFSLANAYADTTSQLSTKPEPRVLGAQKLLAKLQCTNATTLIVSQMKEMCKALIGFANKDNNASKHISSKEPIRKLSNLSFVHCPTLSLPLNKSGKYNNLITVHKWSDTMSLVGGINAPKKVACLCSDGREYPQLLKAKDDLRQDAIMQQVFNILNEMLATHRGTQKRRLTIKTYKVIPLTQRSGILEWCSNSLPLATYLAGVPGKPGAHERYHPDDLKPTQCRKIISNYHAEKMPISRKLEVFQQIVSQFRPALHYFFLEKFQSPGEWFERRLAYTKSVATTSMIGYVLGIGDRHLSNILIDEKTAELIHIDFGIAFEQSKCLPTPETVPFRLTNDIVSAFGVSGVDGIFRKACESTMDVLRLNKTIIVTILEVLLHDPLYAWALSAKSAYSRQDIERADDGAELRPEKNIMAERALTRMEAKLNGEGSTGNTVTVEVQVEMLITDAMNPYNLCRLFEGWQAYL